MNNSVGSGSWDMPILYICMVLLYMTIVGTNNFGLSCCLYGKRFRIYHRQISYGTQITNSYRIDMKIWWMLIIPYWKTKIGEEYSGIGENTESDWCELRFKTLQEALKYISSELNVCSSTDVTEGKDYVFKSNIEPTKITYKIKL